MTLTCPNCGSEDIIIGGVTKHIPPRVLLICGNCGYSNALKPLTEPPYDSSRQRVTIPHICRDCGANWGYIYLIYCPACGSSFLTQEEYHKLFDSSNDTMIYKGNEPKGF